MRWKWSALPDRRRSSSQKPAVAISSPSAEHQSRLHRPRGDAREQQRKDRRHQQHDAGVRQRGHQTEQQGVAGGAPFADEVGGHHRLAVSRRQGVDGPQEGGAEQCDQSQPRRQYQFLNAPRPVPAVGRFGVGFRRRRFGLGLRRSWHRQLELRRGGARRSSSPGRRSRDLHFSRASSGCVRASSFTAAPLRERAGSFPSFPRSSDRGR